MDWSVKAKVSRAIKADGRATVARKCMLTQCADYDYIWLDVKSMWWLWWCKVYIRNGRRCGEWCGLVRGWDGPKCCHRHDGARSGLELNGFMFSAKLGRVNWLCNCICILYVVHTVRRNKHDVFLEKDFVEWAWSLRLKTNPSPSAVSCWRQGLTSLFKMSFCHGALCVICPSTICQNRYWGSINTI